MSEISRRVALGALATLGCSRRSEASSGAASAPVSASAPVTVAPTASTVVDAAASAAPIAIGPRAETHEWDLGARGRAVVCIAPAATRSSADRYPLVVALHGRGESVKGPARGPWGWPRDYALVRAADRIVAPPLSRADYEGLVEPARLARVNERLRARPFGGLVVVCPYLPDFDWSRPPRDMVDDYARFVLEELVPRARRELPVLPESRHTGIDGVSLGGAMGIRVGFRNAAAFGAVGVLQCALNPGQVEELTELARRARAANPTLAIRVATSNDDAFVHSNHALADSLRAANVPRQFEDHLGPHDYVWNRGPGSYELLLFHDDALRREK